MHKFLMLMILASSTGIFAFSNNEQKILDFRGAWRFEIGDNPHWAKPDFDDSAWEKIFVPSNWEDEGFPGYDGYAWYRLHFNLNNEKEKDGYFIRLGYIDDCDEVYLNGEMIGFQGGFPPDYFTAVMIERNYNIRPGLLNFKGENVLAVRVYDDYDLGGIRSGPLGLYRELPEFVPDLDLSGIWRFAKGDNLKWKEKDFNDSNWEKIPAPSIWQTQGYKNENGYGWYRTTFKLPASLKNERLILLLGKIDDVDETYLNGKKIGQTGDFDDDPRSIRINDNDWQTLRAYYIPRDVLDMNGNNVIAVRVFDGKIHGGIFEGPIGLVTRERYLEWEDRLHGDRREGFDLFKMLFGF